MKFHETHYEDYLISNQKHDLHPKLYKIFNKFPNNVKDLRNLIFFGPSGVGKYTQVLKVIKKYSPTELKYEKKISVTFNKQPFFLKISDIHYEIDMSLLGCNSKLLWHEIFLQIIDIVSAKNEKSGIILCKYFHEIHSELLENFYSYMQKNSFLSVDLKFILLTEHISFIPDNILNCCKIINVPRPTKNSYTKCLNKQISSNIKIENITNIKNIHSSIDLLMTPHKIICNKIIDNILNINELKFLKFRDLLYDIFIYNWDITECVWYIVTDLIKKGKIKSEHISDILIKTYVFFQYYNNNYRPIYHLENYLFYIANIVHNFDSAI